MEDTHLHCDNAAHMGGQPSSESTLKQPAEESTPLQNVARPSRSSITESLRSAPSSLEENANLWAARPDTFLSDVKDVFTCGDEVWRSRWLERVRSAQANSFMHRCVKRWRNRPSEIREEERDPTKEYLYGRYETITGVTEVERFPFAKGDHHELHKYGCSVAVELFQSFQLQAAALLCVMFLVSLAPMINMVSRNFLRLECRQALAAGRYAELTAMPRPTELAKKCGYIGSDANPNTNFGVMQFPPEVLLDLNWLPWALPASMGACMEYSNVTYPVEVQFPVLGARIEKAHGEVYVDTDTSEFCIGNFETDAHGAVNALCQALNVLLLLSFLVWVRRHANDRANKLDIDTWTAADYAVLIEGLEVGAEPEAAGADRWRGTPGLKPRLLADLAALGFGEGAIDHVAIGVNCREELRLIRRHGELQIVLDEIAERERLNVARGSAATTARATAKFQRAEAELESTRSRIVQINAAPRQSTGHAFVVFQLETDRNRLLRLFHNSKGLPAQTHREHILAAAGGALHSEAAGAQMSVKAAPEPAEVNWANLELDDRYEKRAQLITYSLCTLLVLGMMVLTTYMKATGAFVVTVYDVPIDAGYYICVCLGNPLVTLLVTYVSTWEGMDTATEEEASVFTKLRCYPSRAS